MISKELFIKVIKNIREQEKIDRKFGNALELVCDGNFVYGTENLYLASLLDVLKEGMHDVDDLISWFLWDNIDHIITLANGTEIDVNTSERLYDYLYDEYRNNLNG